MHALRRPAWSIAGRHTPPDIAVAVKVPGIAAPVLLLHIRRTPAVLEVVAALAPHVCVANPAQINPHVTELMDEERTGVQIFDAIERHPSIRGSPLCVACARQRMRR